ncbi:type II toxin-antitoxin system Phd/YefM family antitoxin [Ferrovibrio sp. MS7]|uniref:type II toxin-antitoxin system Phd/YefM family antitoxin n=1 Tax=Ferrovibrio plantarum TaxID=3119164 RepID=UPI003137479D
MRTFSSANAKNHFGELVDAARIAPVAITKYDKPFVVVLAMEEFVRLSAAAATLRAEDLEQVGKRIRK